MRAHDILKETHWVLTPHNHEYYNQLIRRHSFSGFFYFRAKRPTISANGGSKKCAGNLEKLLTKLYRNALFELMVHYGKAAPIMSFMVVFSLSTCTSNGKVDTMVHCCLIMIFKYRLYEKMKVGSKS